MIINERWSQHFLKLALQHSRMSKDPSNRFGAIIVGEDKEVLMMGFNGFPRGINDTTARIQDKEMKLKLTVHAELNAVLAAGRVGVRLKGTTLFLAGYDETGELFGGPPCTRCVVELIQAGIGRIVAYPIKQKSRWKADLMFAKSLLDEAKISFTEIIPCK